MRQFNWRTAAIAALTSSIFATYSVAQAPANSGGDNKSGSSQGSASNNSSQGQNQASNNNGATGNSNNTGSNTQSNSAQGSRDSKSSDQNNSQGQSNPNKENASSQRSNSSSKDRNSARDRDERDSANSDRDDRSGARDRSNRDYDRNDDRNSENRSSRSDNESSRDHSSRRGNMRGPDIGLWFNRSSRDGLVISDVSSRGAIAKLGFREGDRIVSVNGHRVTREDEFLQYLLRGDIRRVKVIVLRDNREETIYVEPAVLTDEYEYTEVAPLERFGVILDDRYDDRIVVWRVIPRSPAYYAGFRPGDVIVTFGGRPYRTRSEFETGSRDWKTGDANVQIRRGDRQRDLSVEIPALDRSDRRRDERSEVRSEQTDQRDSTSSDQRTTDRSDRSTNDQGNNNNRGGILNGIGRGRGSR
jgi:C-terminal processing protease CtpA/Prc